MNIKIVDFEKITKCYKPYTIGYNEIKKVYQEGLDDMDKLKEEYMTLAKRLQGVANGLILDEQTQKDSQRRMYEVAEEMQQKDQIYKDKIDTLNSELNKKTFDELKVIFDEIGKEKGYDMIMSKSNVIFNKGEFEITDEVIEILKTKELYELRED